MELKKFIPKKTSDICKKLSKRELELINSLDSTKEKIIAVLKLIYDPEISINIWELGLIYHISITSKNTINITMTLTSPTCPVANIITKEIEESIKKIIYDIKKVSINLVWHPRWNKSMMSEEARFTLDMM